jgi:hypothetical protein
MGDGDDPPDVTGLDPDEAFGLFGHEIRVGILLTLWEATGHSMRFGDLREAVGVRDKGKFNYHLSKLVGQFLARDDGEYELRYAGHRAVDAIQTGVFHESPTVEPFAIDSTCHECGHAHTFAYADHVGTVACPDCGTTAFEYPFDPGGLDGRSGEALASAFSRRTRHVWTQAVEGVCPICTGRVGTTVAATTDALPAIDHVYDREAVLSDHPAILALDCRRCSYFSYVPVGTAVLAESAAGGPLSGSVLDVGDRYLWELAFVVDGSRLTVAAEDPWELTVTVPGDDGDIDVTLDGSLAVESVARRFG